MPSQRPSSPVPFRSDRELFSDALALADPRERRAYLLAACGDDQTRLAAIEAMLRAHFESQSNLLDKAERCRAVEDTCDSVTPCGSMAGRKAPFPQIDRYKVRELIGEGGMGLVYVADQTAPVRRRVALKVIKPGMDSESVLARFDAERQALALMDHPNIARVLDGGLLDDGRPYFVMELVQGVPITDFCDENRLTIPQRLTLFCEVCAAVYHAHQKGIIHRDLKPSNILVTMNDDKPQPKIIDFGIAKALAQPLTEHSIYTAYGQMVGTPMYMSPEQAQFSAIDVDTRSDVYSLGIVLYCLLTGGTPIEQDSLQKSGLDEMRRIICDVDPPRPSQRVSTLKAEQSTTVALKRSLDTRMLGRTLTGELDCIVMKSLEKDRKRRYQSPREFAEDIQAYLNGEPIRAVPPSLTYRLQKGARKHRVALAIGALFLGGLLATLCGTSWQAYRATRAERALDHRLSELRIEQERTKSALSSAERAEAEQRRLRAVAEGAADREREAASRQRELTLQAKQSEKKANWNLYVARLQPMQQALVDHDYGRLDGLLRASVPTANDPDFRGWEWYFLRDLADKAFQRLQLNGAFVRGPATWNPTGTEFATGGPIITVWDPKTRLPTRTIPCDFWVNLLEWSPDGKKFLVGNADGTCVVIDASTGRILARRAINHQMETDAWLVAVKWAPDSKRLAISNWNAEVFVWDFERDRLEQVHTFAEETGLGGAIDWHPDGQRLAIGLRLGNRKILSLTNGQSIDLDTNTLSVGFCVKWNPTGTMLATGAYNDIQIWSPTGESIAVLRGHGSEVRSLAWKDDRTLISTGIDHTLRVWDAGEQTLADTFEISDGPLNYLAISPLNDLAICGNSEEADLRICRLHPFQIAMQTALTPGRSWDADFWTKDGGRASEVSHLSWSEDGQQLAVTADFRLDAERSLGICGVYSSASAGHGNARVIASCDGLSWSDGDDFLLISTVLGIEAQRPNSGAILQDVGFASDETGVTARWSPNHRWLVRAVDETALRLFDARTLEPQQDAIPKLGKRGTSLSWSAASDALIGTGHQTPTLYRIDTRQLTHYPGSPYGNFGTAWHPSGKIFAIGNGEGALKIYGLDSIQPIATLDDSMSPIRSVDFSPDGRRLAVGGEDGTVLICDVATGAALLKISLDGGAISCLRFSPDGVQLAAGMDGKIAIVGFPTGSGTPTNSEWLESGVIAKYFDAATQGLLAPIAVDRLAWRNRFAEWVDRFGGIDTPIDPGRVQRVVFEAIEGESADPSRLDAVLGGLVVFIESTDSAESGVQLTIALNELIRRDSNTAAALDLYLPYVMRANDASLRRMIQAGQHLEAERLIVGCESLLDRLQQAGASGTRLALARLDVDAWQWVNAREQWLAIIDGRWDRGDRRGRTDVASVRSALQTAYIRWKQALRDVRDRELLPMVEPGEALSGLVRLLQEHSGDELYLGVLPTFRQEFCELLLSIGAGDTSYQVALIQASAGDLMGYRAACRVGLERFASADDPVLRDRFVWAATLAPDGLASYIELVAMARTVATEASGHVPVCIGAALYRSGQFEEAAARLRDALANPGPGVAPAYALFFLAMVEYQQGHREAACEILQQATAEAATGPTEVPWNRRWTLRLLEREAAQLIVGDA